MAKRKGTQSETKTTAEVASTFEAVYCGRRLTAAGRLAYFWKKDFEDSTMGYRKQLAPALIGERWKFSALASGAVITSGPHRPVKIGSQTKNSETARWAALDAAHSNEYDAEKLSRKLEKRKTEFEEALEPLRRMLHSLPTHTERGCFIQRVVIELWRKP